MSRYPEKDSMTGMFRAAEVGDTFTFPPEKYNSVRATASTARIMFKKDFKVRYDKGLDIVTATRVK